MNLRRQIIRSQALSWLLVLVVGALVFASIRHNASVTDQRRQSQAELLQIEVIRTDMLDLETGLRGYLVTGVSQFLDPFDRARLRINSDIDTAYGFISNNPEDAAQREALRGVQQRMNQWLGDVADPEINTIRQNPNAAASLALQTRGKQMLDEVRGLLDQYAGSERASVDQLTNDANQSLNLLQWVTVAGLLGAVVVSLLTSLWLAQAIAGPSVRLAEAARRHAAGALNERVEESGARELRQMAHAYNEMAAQLESAHMDLEERNALLSARTGDLERASVTEHTLGDALRAFTSSYDRDAILRALLAMLAERHGFLIGAIYGYDEWAGEFVVAARYGTARDLQERFVLRDGIIGQAVLDRRVLVVTQAPMLTINTGLTAAPAPVTVIVPVYYQDRIMGAMALGHTAPPDEAMRGFLNQLGQQLGIALQNLDQYTNLQQLSSQLQARQEEIEHKNSELERADQMKSEFLANMSHELRTPLNAIIGFSELLQEQFYGPLNVEQDEYLGNIRTAGEHLLGLINDILDLSKIEAGRMELEFEEIDVSLLLTSSLTIVKEKAYTRGVQLVMDAADVTTIVADARKLKQVLFNLLSNAVKFTPAGGTVTMSAWHEGEIAAIAVTDTGVGISAEDQQRLFQAFTQVDGSLSRRHEGTGLGLALTKRIVELHGGTITVVSAPGEGSTFTVRLPIGAAISRGVEKPGSRDVDAGSSLPDSPTPRLPDSGEAPLVLVIEDDDPTAELIIAYLDSAGYRTARATNGLEGLEMARQLQPDGITLDVMMPVMDGWAFLEQAGADPALHTIPVIVLSLANDLSHGFSLGASAILSKPVRRDELFQALANAHLLAQPDTVARILVVDDDPRAVELIGDFLTSFGHHVSRAYGGAHGIELAEREHPDLVILDLMMPEVNGFKVVERLHANPRTADIPIIILTAKIVSAEERQRLNGQIVAVAEKSGLNRAGFLTEVRRAVRQRETADSRS